VNKAATDHDTMEDKVRRLRFRILPDSHVFNRIATHPYLLKLHQDIVEKKARVNTCALNNEQIAGIP
jgi:hypothetical protein